MVGLHQELTQMCGKINRGIIEVLAFALSSIEKRITYAREGTAIRMQDKVHMMIVFL